MHFATPIWLLALVPWAALVVWMLWGRREQVAVPFLTLWEGGEATPTISRAVRPPPIAVALVLLSILLAILAAATPTASLPHSLPVTVLVDRGITMSAREGDAYCYQRLAATLEPHLHGPVKVFAVPARDVPGLADIASLHPTAMNTADDVAQAAMRLLATTTGPVVVLTDRPPPGVSDARLVVVAPEPLKENAGIAYVAARAKPAAQVMVRVNGDASRKIPVVVSSGGQRVEREVQGTAFIDLPQVGQVVEVSLAQSDALSADDRAWLVREVGWPRIEAGVKLPDELSRMVEAYRKLRPSRAGAGVVLLVEDANDAAGEAVILAPAAESGASGGAPDVADHPVTRGAAWAEVWRDARVSSEQPPSGFVPVVARGQRVAVAVREQPSRQVWVALESEAFPRRPDYVVFWTNVFDWLGRGGDEFASHPIGLLGNEWAPQTDGPEGTEPGLWPGLYRRGDGTLRSVNAGPVELPPTTPPPDDWRERLADLSRAGAAGAGGHRFSAYLLLAALVCALVAALFWPARSRGKP